MARHIETLDGGLVTSRDAALLQPGELAKTDNAVYRASSDGALHRAPGRTRFGTVASGEDIKGLAVATFDNGEQHLIAAHSTGATAYYSIADVTGNGTFSTAAAITSGDWLSAVQYNNLYFLLNGANANLVMRQGGTTRAHGLPPVSDQCEAVTAAGTWSLTTTGWFEYWTTETIEYSENGTTTELESTFTGDPKSVQVTATNQQVVVTRPDIVTSGTGWRVYRAWKELRDEQAFPAGYLVASLSSADIQFVDGLAASITGVASATATASAGTDWYIGYAISADDGTRARLVSSAPYPTGNFTYVLNSLNYFGADPGVGEPVQGIEVTIQAHWTADTAQTFLYVGLSNDNGATWSDARMVQLSTVVENETTIGSPTDPWGLSWTNANLANGKFLLRLIAKGYNVGSPGVNCEVDYVKVTVYYNGTANAAETPFPNYSFTVGGETLAGGLHGQPPTANTGDIFEGALVLNDVSASSKMWWSVPTKPEYFPAPYHLDFSSPDNDQITLIKTLGNRLVVGLKNSVWRVNYLPTEDSAQFNTGRSVDLVTNAVGVVNPYSATLFRGPGGRVELAFVSFSGIFATDGFTVRELTSDLDFAASVNVTALASASMLLDHPDEHELLFFCPEPGQTEMRRCYHFNYHPRHIKEGGRLKISGPTQVFNDDGTSTAAVYSGAFARASGGQGYLFLGYGGDATASADGGDVYVQAASATGWPTNGADASIHTRYMALAGLGNEFKITDLYLYRKAVASDAPTIEMYGKSTNATGSSQIMATATLAAPGSPDGTGILTKAMTNVMTEAAQIRLADSLGGSAFAETSVPWRYDLIVIDGEDFGREDSGK